MQVTISRAAKQAIRDHAAETPGLEVCGLLFGSKGYIEVAKRATNVASRPETHFEVDPQALFAAVRADRNGEFQMLGHYHSHPDGEAKPSDHDAAMALDVGRIWIIIAGDEMTAWHVDTPGHLNPVELALASEDGQRQ